MKKQITIAMLLVALLLSNSCNRNPTMDLNSFYNKYQNTESVKLKVPGLLARLVINDPEANELLRHIRSANVMVLNKNNIKRKSQVRSDLLKVMNHSNYEDLITIVSDQEFISIKALQKNDFIKHLVIAIDEADETILLDFKTNTSIGQIEQWLEKAKSEGKINKDKLKKLF